MMPSNRWDETWHRLREWTNGSAPSERLAAQILQFDGYVSLDPSHPLGGPDGGRDAICQKNGQTWVMAVFFPRGQATYSEIRRKLERDVESAAAHKPTGIAFVTNQELTLAERSSLRKGLALDIDLFHLERVTTILDAPAMGPVREQFLGISVEGTLPMSLGGIGGLAPGAGGGGGGAIGNGARGGDGGPGGRMRFIGTPGLAPGAGGGGAGAEGEGAQGGDGGGGGELVHLEISPEKLSELRKYGFHHFEFRVGQGGKNGGPGEDTILHLVTADGDILESVIAKGGLPGTSSSARPKGRTATPEDLAGGFRVSSALFAESAQIRNGLFNMLGAGWSNFQFETVPFEANWPLCLTFDACPRSSEPLLVEVCVRQPDGFLAAIEALYLPPGEDGASRMNFLMPLRFTGSMLGIWLIEIQSGKAILGKVPLEIRGPA